MIDRLRRVGRLLVDPRTPKLPRLVLVLAMVYLLLPIDLLPDWTPPLVGWIDDFVVLWLSLRWLLKQDTSKTPPSTRPIPSMR